MRASRSQVPVCVCLPAGLVARFDWQDVVTKRL